MAIRLFERTNRRGDFSDIGRDENDLGHIDVGRNPSSMVMGDAGDAVLLFKRPEWRGGVMFRRGRNTINNLGSPRAGGRNTFRNGIASARVTPFHVKLNITAVSQSDGTLPGGYPNLGALSDDFDLVLSMVNDFYEREQALLRVEAEPMQVRVNNNKFNITMAESWPIPASWKNRREIDCILVNSGSGFTGLGRPPHWGKVIIIALRNSPTGRRRTLGAIGRTVAHEIGHFLGSGHVDAPVTNVLRTPTPATADITTATATVDQIQEWHTKLSRNMSRRRNRRGD